jgi:hypothetical protein
MAVAVVLTLTTGLDYVAQAYRMRERSERTRLKRAARRAARPLASSSAGEAGPAAPVVERSSSVEAAPGGRDLGTDHSDGRDTVR